MYLKKNNNIKNVALHVFLVDYNTKVKKIIIIPTKLIFFHNIRSLYLYLRIMFFFKYFFFIKDLFYHKAEELCYYWNYY